MKKKIKRKNTGGTAAQDDFKAKTRRMLEKEDLLDRVIELGILFLIGVSPLVFLRIGGEFDNNPKMGFLQWGIAILALLKVLRIKKGGEFRWKRTPLDIPIILFYCFCWLSLLPALKKTPLEFNPWQATLSLLHWGAAIILYFILVNSIKKDKTIRHIFFVTSMSVCIVSVIGILQKLQIDTPFIHISDIPQMVSPASTFSNKNMGAEFVGIAIPFLIGSVFIARHWRSKLLCACSLIVSVIYVICTWTRSALLGISAVFSIMVFTYLYSYFPARIKKYLRLKNLKYAAATVALILVLLWISPARESIYKLPGHLEGSWRLRSVWWINTMEMVKDNFWFGVGLGNFKITYPPYHCAALKNWGFKDWSFSEGAQLTRVHNDHLQMLAELGIFGFCAYSAMFVAFFYIFRKIYFKEQDTRKKLMADFICLGVVSFFFIALFTFPLERANHPIYLFTFFGLMGYIYNENFPNERQISIYRGQSGIRILISLFILAYLCSSIYFIRKVVLSDKYFVEALNMGERGKIKESNDLLKKAEEAFYMWNFNISSLLARNYTMQGNYELAIEEYKKSFEAHPNNTNAILNTGYCYLKLNNFDESEKFFNKFIKIIPDSAKGNNNIGIVCYSKKEFDKAEEYYKKACELDPTYAEPHFNLANLYRTQGKIQEAIQESETALKMKPGMDDARNFLSSIYMEKGDIEKAREIVAPILKNKNEAMEYYLSQANIYQQQGKHEEALNLYLEALNISPQNPFIHYNIGLAYYYLKDFVQAEKALKTSVALNPEISDSYNLLGQLYLRKKDDAGALKFFQKALDINPKLSDASFNIGTIHLRMGNYDLSAKEYEKTLQMDPDFSLAHYNLATILRHQGKKKEALLHFEKSIENPSKRIDITLAKKFIDELKNDIAKKPEKQ